MKSFLYERELNPAVSPHPRRALRYLHDGLGRLTRIDNECNPEALGGMDDPLVGADCDGSDSDFCVEGTYFCSSGSLQCSDNTAGTIDLCNGVDDDCDSASTDGSEDPALGAARDGSDGDLCIKGTNSCSAGALACSDTTSTTVEICNTLDDDCDGTIDEGFLQDHDPAFGQHTYLGQIPGDGGGDQKSAFSHDEKWYRVRLLETNFGSLFGAPQTATVQLSVPAGVEFDLYVYCLSCCGNLAGSSKLGDFGGHTESVRVRKNDNLSVDDTFEILIEVGDWNAAANSCATWSLTVVGNTEGGSVTCN